MVELVPQKPMVVGVIKEVTKKVHKKAGEKVDGGKGKKGKK